MLPSPFVVYVTYQGTYPDAVDGPIPVAGWGMRRALTKSGAIRKAKRLIEQGWPGAVIWDESWRCPLANCAVWRTYATREPVAKFTWVRS